MSDAIKNWLPITVRNRVALGFAFASLVMFVTWNLLPNYNTVDYDGDRPIFESDGLVYSKLWPVIFNPEIYHSVIKSPNVGEFLVIAAFMSLLMNGLIVLSLVPFWKILHATNYLRIPVAIVHLIGGGVVLKFFFKGLFDSEVPPFENLSTLLISVTMLMVFIAMMIFKNELTLRHDQEVKQAMAGE